MSFVPVIERALVFSLVDTLFWKSGRRQGRLKTLPHRHLVGALPNDVLHESGSTPPDLVNMRRSER